MELTCPPQGHVPTPSSETPLPLNSPALHPPLLKGTAGSALSVVLHLDGLCLCFCELRALGRSLGKLLKLLSQATVVVSLSCEN